MTNELIEAAVIVTANEAALLFSEEIDALSEVEKFEMAEKIAARARKHAAIRFGEAEKRQVQTIIDEEVSLVSIERIAELERQLAHLQSDAGSDSCADIMAKLAAVRTYCQARNHSGCNPGTHRACADILRIIEQL